MTRSGSTLIAIVLLSLGACDKKKDTTGLPPASKWNAAGGGGASGGGGAGGGGAVDPHAGVDMSGGGGGAVAGDPHAGVDMSGGAMGGAMAGADPHGGGGAVPVRPVDPNHYLRGTITVAPKLKDKVKAGGALFISVKRPDPTTGEGVGMPLAVEKLELNLAGVPFDLNEENAMTGPGTVDLSGEVVITARYDQDGDAFSKQPGDVTGKLKVTVPGKDLKLVLDTVQP